MVHYLDDFLMIVPQVCEQNPATYSKRFSKHSAAIGSAIKVSKNKKGRVASVGGIELDTERMVICLPQMKLTKALLVVQNAIMATSLSQVELHEPSLLHLRRLKSQYREFSLTIGFPLLFYDGLVA